MGRTVVATDRLMRPIAQFSFGMRAANVVRIGATAGTDAARSLAGESPGRVDVSAQTGRMLENFEISLDLLGARIADVVQLRTWLVDWRDLAAYEAAVQRRWPNISCCHSIVGSVGFPIPQAAVEAELLAIVGGGPASEGRTHHVCSVGPADEALGADPAARAHSCIDRLEAALSAAGMASRDLVMLGVNTSDLRLMPIFDRVCRERLKRPYPARTVSGTGLRDPRWLFALDAIAIAGGGMPIGSDDAEGGAPASSAMLAGDELFIGGVRGCTTGTTRIESIEAQTHRAWETIEALLSNAGMTSADVLHTTNTLTDWRSYGAFNKAYGAHVTAPYPPRATVVGGLVDEPARVMIDVQAHRGGRDGRFIGYVPPPGAPVVPE